MSRAARKRQYRRRRVWREYARTVLGFRPTPSECEKLRILGESMARHLAEERKRAAKRTETKIAAMLEAMQQDGYAEMGVPRALLFATPVKFTKV